MARPVSPLSPDPGPVFAVAAALDLGIGRNRLRRSDLVAPVTGVRSVVAPSDLAELARALAMVLPRGTVFSHETAALLLGLPTVAPWDGRTVHVTTPPGSARIVRRHVVGHRGAPSGVRIVAGIPVTAPVCTWGDLAALRAPAWLRVPRSVMVADAVLRSEDATPDQLSGEVTLRTGARGVRTLRRAAPLARAGSASPMESIARVILVEGAVPEPELNAEVDDLRGQVLGHADMLWRRQRVLAEYEGDQHRSDVGQWRYDIRRYREFESAGWSVLRFTADDVLRAPERLIGSVTRALSARESGFGRNSGQNCDQSPTLAG